MIESARDQDIEAIIKEFDLEPADAYFDRTRRTRMEMIDKLPKARAAQTRP